MYVLGIGCAVAHLSHVHGVRVDPSKNDCFLPSRYALYCTKIISTNTVVERVFCKIFVFWHLLLPVGSLARLSYGSADAAFGGERPPNECMLKRVIVLFFVCSLCMYFMVITYQL